MALQVVVGRPPNYQDIVLVLGRPPINAVFTYGERLFVQTPQQARLVGPILLSHEEVHRVQQEKAGDPATWWRSYLVDRAFRLANEVEAYRAEYAHACSRITNRSKRRIVLAMLARHLANPMYGGLVTTKQAVEMIR